MPGKRSFVVQTKGGQDTKHFFTGAAPRQAALKAARAHLDNGGVLKIRERGTDTIHEYKTSTKTVEASEWLQHNFGVSKVTVASVKKQGVMHDCDRKYIQHSIASACPQKKTSKKKTSAKKKKRISYVKAGTIYYSSEGKPYKCPKGWQAKGKPMKKSSKQADRKKCTKQK